MLPLSDRKEFLLRADDFTPFVFNDVSLTDKPARNSEKEEQISVTHVPPYKRQKIKLKVNFINQPTTAPTLQGDTGANTSATDRLELLHHYKEFKQRENVGVFFDDKDKTEAITLKAHGIGYIYIISDQGTTMRLGDCLYTTRFRYCSLTG